MKQLLTNSRSKYLFTLGLIAILIGLTSKKVITYPTECAPINNREMTYLIKLWKIKLIIVLKIAKFQIRNKLI